MRSLIRGLPRLAFGGVPAERAGDIRLACARLRVKPSRVQLRSADFEDGGELPLACTADGAGTPPRLSWTGVPKGARSLALLVEDPDAPTPYPFVHWIVYDIPPHAGSIGAAVTAGARVGRNSMMRSSWAPCAPPRGDTPHRYIFQLFALDQSAQLSGHAGRAAVIEEMAGHVIGFGALVGTWRR